MSCMPDVGVGASNGILPPMSRKPHLSVSWSTTLHTRIQIIILTFGSPGTINESAEHLANLFRSPALGQLMHFFFLHLKASPSYLTHDGVGLPPRPLSSE